ncbi:unnamed protein product, partial [Prorocentrum cordatum]
ASAGSPQKRPAAACGAAAEPGAPGKCLRAEGSPADAPAAGDRSPEPCSPGRPSPAAEAAAAARRALEQRRMRVLERRLAALLPSLPRARLSTPYVQARLEEFLQRPPGRLDRYRDHVERIWRAYARATAPRFAEAPPASAAAAAAAPAVGGAAGRVAGLVPCGAAAECEGRGASASDPEEAGPDAVEVDGVGFQVALGQIRGARTPGEAEAVLRALLTARPTPELLRCSAWEPALARRARAAAAGASNRGLAGRV